MENRSKNIVSICKFLKFLRLHGLTSTFLVRYKEFCLARHYTNDEIPRKLFNFLSNYSKSESLYIIYAFSWNGTLEGFQFWQDISIKWSEFLKE